MKKLPAMCALLGAITATSVDAVHAQSTDPYIGQIMFTAANFCPQDWAPLDGRVLSIIQNTALFSLIGTRYGGNGQTTFQLPLIVPIRTGNGQTLMGCICLEGIFPPHP